MESLDSLSVDIARMIDHDAAAELWERYKRGERNVFTRRLYTMQGQQTFEEIRKRYRADREFRQTVDRYIGEFERLLEEVSQGERGQATARSYLTSDTGKVYTMLAHAAGRFEGQRVSALERLTNEGRVERRALVVCARFWHRGVMASDAHRPHRTLADRRQLHDRARREDRSRGGGRRIIATARRRGRGECVPYARYGETVESVAAAHRGDARRASPAGSTARALQSAMPAGAARNALDCAFWDLEAKRAGQPVHVLAGLPAPRALRHRLHDLARHAGGDGRGRREGRVAQAAQGEARRGGRSGAHSRGARGCAELPS